MSRIAIGTAACLAVVLTLGAPAWPQALLLLIY